MNLFNFCDNRHSNPIFRRPFTHKNKTVCTNGHMVLFSEFDSQFETIKSQGYIKEFDGFLENIENLVFKKQPAFELPIQINCPVCLGDKTVEESFCPECLGDGLIFYKNGFNQYQITCNNCKRDGFYEFHEPAIGCKNCYETGVFYPPNSLLEIQGKKFSCNYLNAINQPELKIAFEQTNKQLYFKIGSCSGLIAPMVRI